MPVRSWLISTQYLVAGEFYHRQQFLVQFFPRYGDGFACLQVLHTTRYLFVPSCLNGLVCVSTHGHILPRPTRVPTPRLVILKPAFFAG